MNDIQLPEIIKSRSTNFFSSCKKEKREGEGRGGKLLTKFEDGIVHTQPILDMFCLHDFKMAIYFSQIPMKNDKNLKNLNFTDLRELF